MRVLQIIVSLAVALFAIGYIYEIWIFGTAGYFDSILKEHFLASVGIPLSAVAAASIVSVFEFNSGSPISFKFFDNEFSASAGQITLWIPCFLAFIVALKLLW